MPNTTLGRAADKGPTERQNLPPRGFSIGTAVLALDGAIPVEYLSPGDWIITRGGARILRAVHVQVLHNVSAVRISAETLGPDRPEQDVLVAPDQPILVRDWRARAFCGTPQAKLPASRLIDGAYIHLETVPELRLFTLEFDDDVVIYAGGLEVVCAQTAVKVAA